MNQGIEILIARMDSNPEEFVPDVIGNYPSKWRKILVQIEHRIKSKGIKVKEGEYLAIELPFLELEEVEAVWKKLQLLQADLFTKRVMNTLLQDADEELSSFSRNDYARGSKIKLSLSELEMCNKAGIPPAQFAKVKAACK
jgi:hypothetical protein